MKIEGGLRQIPSGHTTSGSMWAFQKMMTNGKAGHLFDHAYAAMFPHPNVSTPVME